MRRSKAQEDKAVGIQIQMLRTCQYLQRGHHLFLLWTV